MRRLYALGLLMGLVLAGCTGEENSPRAAVDGFLKAAKADDKEAAKPFVTQESRKNLEGEKSGIDLSEKTWSFVDTKIEGETATVKVRFEGPKIKKGAMKVLAVVCRREEGRWRVDLNATGQAMRRRAMEAFAGGMGGAPKGGVAPIPGGSGPKMPGALPALPGPGGAPGAAGSAPKSPDAEAFKKAMEAMAEQMKAAMEKAVSEAGKAAKKAGAPAGKAETPTEKAETPEGK